MCTNYVFDADKGAQTNVNKHKQAQMNKWVWMKAEWAPTNHEWQHKHKQGLVSMNGGCPNEWQDKHEWGPVHEWTAQTNGRTTTAGTGAGVG